jgi:chromatin segregation and condensation protein Rec8/ScpA/Scc1 (kleisin family)
MEMLHGVSEEESLPWDVPLAELQRQYPEAVHLLRNAHTI